MDEYLTALYPSKDIEIINAATGGADMVYVREVFSEIVQIGNPDLVIILSGNNERYPNELGPKYMLDENIDNHMSGLTQRYDSIIDDIIRMAEINNVEINMLTVPSNIRDWEPSDVSQFNQSVLDSYMASADYDGCIEYLSNFMNNSLSLYYTGKCYDLKGEYDTAYEFYIRARDTDRSFLRARSHWNDIIRNISSDQVKVIDLESMIAAKASDGIPGYDIFFDYCHFKLEMNQQAAKWLVQEIMVEHFNDKDTSRIEHIELSELKISDLKRIYWLKRIKWLRFKYYSAFSQIRDSNVENVRKSYEKEMQWIDFREEVIRNT